MPRNMQFPSADILDQASTPSFVRILTIRAAAFDPSNVGFIHAFALDERRGRIHCAIAPPATAVVLLVAALFLGMPEAMAHAVAEGDKGFIQESSGVMLLPFIYMGAKHMMTGYDHLLFLFGVIFFLTA